MNNSDPRVQELLVDVAVLKTRLESAQTALSAQAAEYARRLGELNMAHERAEKVLQTYITRDVFERELRELSQWRRTVNSEIGQFPTVRRLAEDTLVWKTSVDNFINQNRGRSSGLAAGWGWIVSGIGVVAAIAGAVAALFLRGGNQ